MLNKILFRFASFLLVTVPFTYLAADIQPLSDATLCNADSSYGGSCYLNDMNTVNQPADTQTQSLGVPNRLIENDMNMFVNPGQVMNYGTAYLEGRSSANLVWGGATVPLPANQKLAVFVRRPMNANSLLGSVVGLLGKYSPALNASNPLNGVTGVQMGILDTKAKGFGNLDAMYGLSMGDMNFGFRLSYANLKNNYDKTQTNGDISKYKISAHNIGVGLGLQWKNLGPGYLDLSLSSDIAFFNASSNYTVTGVSGESTIESTALPSISFLGRYVTPVGQDKLILAVNVDQYKMPLEIRATDSGVASSVDTSASAFNLALDAAYHQMLQDGKLRVIYSAGVGSTNITYLNKASGAESSFESSHFYIPIGVAVEHLTFEAFKTRIGVRKNIFSNKSLKDATPTQTTTQATSFYLDDELLLATGFGWVPADKVQIDFALNATVLSSTMLFSSVSARYHY
ncbi:MAG: hypothetical protein LDLANPLL_01141 [Turneriella sp.]|nr:hypothetical protein [Turneriella sp.]